MWDLEIALRFQRATWSSIKLSLGTKRVVKTPEFETAKTEMGVGQGARNAEAMLEAAATGAEIALDGAELIAGDRVLDATERKSGLISSIMHVLGARPPAPLRAINLEIGRKTWVAAPIVAAWSIINDTVNAAPRLMLRWLVLPTNVLDYRWEDAEAYVYAFGIAAWLVSGALLAWFFGLIVVVARCGRPDMREHWRLLRLQPVRLLCICLLAAAAVGGLWKLGSHALAWPYWPPREGGGVHALVLMDATPTQRTPWAVVAVGRRTSRGGASSERSQRGELVLRAARAAQPETHRRRHEHFNGRAPHPERGLRQHAGEVRIADGCAGIRPAG